MMRSALEWSKTSLFSPHLLLTFKPENHTVAPGTTGRQAVTQRLHDSASSSAKRSHAFANRPCATQNARVSVIKIEYSLATDCNVAAPSRWPRILCSVRLFIATAYRLTARQSSSVALAFSRKLVVNFRTKFHSQDRCRHL